MFRHLWSALACHLSQMTKWAVIKHVILEVT